MQHNSQHQVLRITTERNSVARGTERPLKRQAPLNSVHLMTGAGQGIGRAVAHGLGEAGASVAVVDIDADKADATKAELQAKGIRSIALHADVRNKEHCDRYAVQCSVPQQLLHSSLCWPEA